MRLSNRETLLLWCTMAALLFAATYWYLDPKIEGLKEFKKTQKSLQEEIELYRKIIAKKPEAEKQLNEVRTKLSSYPPDKDVTADYMKVLEKLVKEHGVTLIQRKPQKEKKQNNLYELAIDCTWEAELDSLVKFLHALSKEDMTMDIKDITISLLGAGKSRLKGNFTLLCLYTREGDSRKEANQKTVSIESLSNANISSPDTTLSPSITNALTHPKNNTLVPNPQTPFKPSTIISNEKTISSHNTIIKSNKTSRMNINKR